jgi:hypothetical protein
VYCFKVTSSQQLFVQTLYITNIKNGIFNLGGFFSLALIYIIRLEFQKMAGTFCYFSHPAMKLYAPPRGTDQNGNDVSQGTAPLSDSTGVFAVVLISRLAGSFRE